MKERERGRGGGRDKKSVKEIRRVRKKKGDGERGIERGRER